MNKKKSNAVLWIILIAVLLAVIMVRHFHIKSFYTVEPDVLYTSGQPVGMDYTRLLYRYHIAAIVNVRSPSEHRDHNWYNEEITWTKNNGVKYISLPIEKSTPFPDQQTQDQFIQIMSDKLNIPLLLHGSGDCTRVTLLTAVWSIKSQGYSVEQSLKTARLVKGEPLTTEEVNFIKGLKK